MAKAKKATAPLKAAPAARAASAKGKAPAVKTAKKTVDKVAAAPAGKVSAIKAAQPRGLEKKYLKRGTVCKVTFVLPQDAAPDAASVCLLGEFNNWSADANPLARRPGGDFSVTLELPAGRSYRFRYVIDGWKFENDWFADRYEPNPYGGEDSVVDV